MPRREILAAHEKEAFDSPPVFNSVERKRFLDVTPRVQAILRTLQTPSNAVAFLVRLGYFKATKRFFGAEFRTVDVEFAARKLGFLPELIEVEDGHKATMNRHRRMILTYLGFHKFDDAAKSVLHTEIRSMVRSQASPKFIFRQVVDILEHRKVEIPSSWTLTELILDAIQQHKSELSATIENQLPDKTRRTLDALMQMPDGDMDSVLQRTKLALLKRISQSMRPAKIKTTVDDFRVLRELYREIAPIAALLDLTPDGIGFYAKAVAKSQVFQIIQRSGSDRYLHLICFVTHQCFRLQDALVDILLATVQSVTGTCDREHKELYFNGRDERKQTIRRFLNRLDEGAFAPLTNIETIAFDKGLQDSDKVQQIRNVLVAAKAARESASENLDGLRAQLERHTDDAEYFRALEARSIKLQNRVSEIVKCVEFHGTESGLLEAIHHYQLRDAVITQHSPVAFLPADEQESLYDDDGKMRVSLYKALLFLRVANAVKSGALNISLSYKYRSLDDYLIPRADWEANRKEYVTRAELDGVADCGFRLAQISETLHSRYVHTNRRVLGGENEHVRFFKDGSFHVITPKAEQEDSEPLGFVFPEKRYISLLEVLSTVNRASGFVDAFEHWQTKYSRSRPPDRAFYAGIIGLGCFIGTRKMAQISSQIDAFELENTVNSRFSVENVDAANDRLLAFMGSLPLTDVYRREPDNLHTSSDGQKYEVAVDSLNANYSFKYFGQGKGVAAYNFIDERHFLFHSTVISSSEREAAYVIDGLMHNDVVKSDIHSTDTHGYSEVVFGVMDLLGFSFAPRLKNLKGKVLYSFQEHRRKDYEQQECRILPSKYVDEGLVHRYWDDILRLSATIKLKHATASQIFRRLNSYSTQHPLYAAIKEYGRPLVSDFILRYVDQMGFRQSIEKQLNKLESSNKFSRAVGFGSEEFLQGEKVEQEIAEGCRRLIKNSVVCWNYLYLSQLLADEDDPKQRAQLLAAIKNGSVVTWQHINLHGEYDFSDAKLRDSVGLEAPKLKAFSLG